MLRNPRVRFEALIPSENDNVLAIVLKGEDSGHSCPFEADIMANEIQVEGLRAEIMPELKRLWGVRYDTDEPVYLPPDAYL